MSEEANERREADVVESVVTDDASSQMVDSIERECLDENNLTNDKLSDNQQLQQSHQRRKQSIGEDNQSDDSIENRSSSLVSSTLNEDNQLDSKQVDSPTMDIHVGSSIFFSFSLKYVIRDFLK